MFCKKLQKTILKRINFQSKQTNNTMQSAKKYTIL